MSEPNPSDSTSTTAAAAASKPQPIIRIRSRFPKAVPVLATNSGLARIRRLSGHFQLNENDLSEHHHTLHRTPPSTPHPHHQMIMSPLVNHNENSNSNASISRLQSISKSPASMSHHASPLIKLNNSTNEELIHLSNPSTPLSNNNPITFRQFLTSGISSVPMSPAINSFNLQQPTTPGGSFYNPKFSNDHIMNIIKYKALQKLKKIESESLKEKRKKNLTNQLNCEETDILDRSKVRMRDLLYYNSKTKKQTSDSSNEVIIVEEAINLNASSQEIVLNQSENDDSESLIGDRTNDSLDSELCSNHSSAIKQQQQQSAPQLKFAEDGSIIINEESLIIQRVEVEPHYDSTVVEESENLDNLNYNSYRKFHHTKKWSKRETAKFYKALSMIGTDFTMIQRLFSHRNRDEIKRKFKREEKLNQALIDKILSTTTKFDLSVFVSGGSEDELASEDNNNNNNSEQNNDNTTNQPDEESNEVNNNKKSKKKKPIPKRIQKRAFIESDEEEPLKQTNVNLTACNDSYLPFKINPKPKRIIDDDEEEDDGDDEIILDLDSNTIITNNTVVMDINYNNEINNALDQTVNNNNDGDDDDDEENIILDLDNNTIISSNNKNIINCDEYSQANNNEKPRTSTSSITITRIPKK